MMHISSFREEMIWQEILLERAKVLKILRFQQLITQKTPLSAEFRVFH